jgi:hypothetical protein
MVGIASSCPLSLKELARAVYRKTKMYESGLWTCISCGQVVDLQDTHALMCQSCNAGISKKEKEADIPEKIRKGYGQTE